jgi:hypothetical protein
MLPYLTPAIRRAPVLAEKVRSYRTSIIFRVIVNVPAFNR